MPGYDGTGPVNAGPRTGFGMGFCGSGWRAMFGKPRICARLADFGKTLSREDKVKHLKEVRRALIEELEEVDSAISNPDRTFTDK